MQENTEAQPTEVTPQKTPEEQQTHLRAVAEMRAKAYEQLLDAHIMSLTRVMIASNGVTELTKRQAEKALREAVKFALDFGVHVTDAEIRQKGTVFSKETNTLAGVLVQALDNRMLLLADNMRKEQELVETASKPTTEEQTQLINEVVENKGDN